MSTHDSTLSPSTRVTVAVAALVLAAGAAVAAATATTATGSSPHAGLVSVDAAAASPASGRLYW